MQDAARKSTFYSKQRAERQSNRTPYARPRTKEQHGRNLDAELDNWNAGRNGHPSRSTKDSLDDELDAYVSTHIVCG